MATPEKPGPGPLPAIVGGVVVALVLIWAVGIVVGTITFVLRLAVVVALVVGGLWLWGKLTPDE